MGKKAAKKEEPIGVSFKAEELYEDLVNQVDGAELVLEERTRAAEADLKSLNDYKEEVNRIEEVLKADRTITTSILGDHARSYKATQDVLIQEINALETNLAELREDRELCVHEMEEILRDKVTQTILVTYMNTTFVDFRFQEDEFALVDAQEHEIREKIDQMASEFSSMMEELVAKLRQALKTTLPEDEGYSSAVKLGAADIETLDESQRARLEKKAAAFSKEMQQELIEKMRCFDKPKEDTRIRNRPTLPSLATLRTCLASGTGIKPSGDTAKNMYRTNYHDMVNLREVAVRSDFPSGYAGHDFQHEFDRKDVDPVGVSCTEDAKTEIKVTDRLPAFGGQKAGVPQFCQNPRGANKIPREVFQKINGALAVKGWRHQGALRHYTASQEGKSYDPICLVLCERFLPSLQATEMYHPAPSILASADCRSTAAAAEHV
ncbi:hypothetical protein FOZ60_014812 [Perkinsus olseni]|uniref:Uncharacterized protein n=1 Tax=Perkinsus olseni TaxID=32597 RepID=A0A7J6P6S0_PEROL|nr:hypothetical protein FOZ60_014812 [Perkinsus olseni]